MDITEQNHVSRKKGKGLVVGVLVILLLVVGTAAGYFYKQLDEIKKNPNKVANDETNAVIAAVSKLIVVPTDEQPTVATVTDPSKLKDQAFFTNAKTGNKVLIYTKAKKAILYDPVSNKIVEVAPVSIGDQPAVSGATSVQPATAPTPAPNQ
jgi:lipopolysaccharide export system protein LptC